jgi:hypothetical protein
VFALTHPESNSGSAVPAVGAVYGVLVATLGPFDGVRVNAVAVVVIIVIVVDVYTTMSLLGTYGRF